MFTNEEEKILETELRTKKKRDTKIMMRLMVCVTLCIFTYSPQIFSNSYHRWFPDVWHCSSCGYDNYEGIHRCAVCGTAR